MFSAPGGFLVEVRASPEGLDSHLQTLAAACVQGHNGNFHRMRVDPSKAFDPVPNVVNEKSILFYDSSIGSRMIKAMALSRDSHTICHSEETTVDFAEKLCESIALVSYWT